MANRVSNTWLRSWFNSFYSDWENTNPRNGFRWSRKHEPWTLNSFCFDWDHDSAIFSLIEKTWTHEMDLNEEGRIENTNPQQKIFLRCRDHQTHGASVLKLWFLGLDFCSDWDCDLGLGFWEMDLDEWFGFLLWLRSWFGFGTLRNGFRWRRENYLGFLGAWKKGVGWQMKKKKKNRKKKMVNRKSSLKDSSSTWIF